ncbi:unnamed protein product [Oppiella nova]|uniref:Uncharacterized protein n=1 Tax=Oppiella nova TaxID=334625 RepID=A0A7R9QMZ2_9ACAR|nr:unnamed protein product [Oppiella nova]CAG2168516.1 unnamed protein product [Oppiella nova]
MTGNTCAVSHQLPLTVCPLPERYTDCTADEYKTMSHIMDEVIAVSDTHFCKAYPYVHGLQTCNK